MNPRTRSTSWLYPLAGCAILVLATLAIYFPILFPAQPNLVPWGSDTLGHILRMEFVRQGIQQGDWYPDLLPQWYLGIELLRYYPPLPYYLLAALATLLGDSLAAANWLIALCALAGGLACLPLQRWVGWPAAILGGGLYLFLPDHVRISLAEGNLPRALAAALLPVALYCLLRSLEDNPAQRYRVGLGVCLALIVVTHAMMASIYAAGLGLVALLLWFGRQTNFRRFSLAIAAMSLGLGTTAAWLLPSLTGGITELNAASMTEALDVFSLGHYFNPWVRQGNPEILYVGAVLLAATLGVLLVKPARSASSLALIAVGWAGVLIGTPGVNDLYNAMPLHNLMWPLRFLGMSSFLLLLGFLWTVQSWPARFRWAPYLILAGIALDSAGSLGLIHLRPPHPEIQASLALIEQRPGYRQATLDESRLGSEASYAYAAGNREQVYGWAYQGAQSATLVAGINEALTSGYQGYLLDRLNWLGVDDIILLNSLPTASTLGPALTAAGFEAISTGPGLSQFHRDGTPRAFAAEWRALGIGRNAQNIAYLFPQLWVGTSRYVDDYSVEELARYETVVLSGFQWHDRARAEDLVRQATARGVRVVVDLTGTPVDPVARIPHFLDVWAEPVILFPEPFTITGSTGSWTVQPFGEADALWYTFTPQGLEQTDLTFDYLGETATVTGRQGAPGSQIYFLGINLAYHAAQTHDPAAIEILADLLQLPSEMGSTPQAVAMQDYTAGFNGYSFRLHLATPQTLLIPIAFHPGMEVAVNHQPVTPRSYETLTVLDLPAGDHLVQIRLRPPHIQTVGLLITLGSLLAWLGWLSGGIGWAARRWLQLRLAPAAVLVIVLVLVPLTTVSADGPINLDGQFGDWTGRANVTDNPNDGDRHGDIRAFYFSTDPNVNSLYFMAERWDGNSPFAEYTLSIDTNNNGSFADGVDRQVLVSYDPKNGYSEVNVAVYTAAGGFLGQIASGANWGDSKDPGTRVEWSVPFSSVGITPGQPIRIALSSGIDRSPDSGDIQWSPANALGWPLLTVAACLGVGLLVYRRKQEDSA